jgi:ligand-binding SRPBCC domain-containing protein
VPRYLVERTFTVSIEDMPPVASRSKRLVNGTFPEITWEHSHVVVTDDGQVRTFCVYAAPDEAMVREHSQELGEHTIDVIHEIAGDVSPEDLPDE